MNKFLLFPAVLMISLGAHAESVKPTNAPMSQGSLDVKTAIETSAKYKAIIEKYKAMGGSFKCSNYAVVAKTNVSADTMPEYQMTVYSVIANCIANPNDGLDSIQERLLSQVTAITDKSGELLQFDVVSASVVAPPQAE